MTDLPEIQGTPDYAVEVAEAVLNHHGLDDEDIYACCYDAARPVIEKACREAMIEELKLVLEIVYSDENYYTVDVVKKRLAELEGKSDDSVQE